VSGLYFAAAVFLLLRLLGGFLRVVRGPHAADRMLGTQLLGSAASRSAGVCHTSPSRSRMATPVARNTDSLDGSHRRTADGGLQ
jgi:hypothetical protein